MKISCLCVPLLLLAASPVFAQCGNRGVVVRGNTVCTTPAVVVTHHEEVAHEIITPIVVPVALPVIVPAFTYQYAPPVSVAPAAYPGYAPPAYGTPGYAPQVQPGQYGPYQQPPTQPQQTLPSAGNNNDKLRDLARLLLEEMRKQQDSEGGDDGPPMAVYPGAKTPAAPPATLRDQPNPQSPYAQPAINALAKNCMSCHTGPGAKGDTMIFSQPNVLNPDAPFKSMLKELSAGRMPPKTSNYHVNPQENGAITAWLEGR